MHPVCRFNACLSCQSFYARFVSRSNLDPVFLVGPTAVGKSEVALLLAMEMNAEIVSADSVQVYRGMDIGTAKPTKEERSRAPHHLIDVVNVCQPFNVAEYRQLATTAIAQIQQKSHLPLVVGGSGLYLRALSEGLFEGPGADERIRAELETQPAEVLFERLRKVDPISAKKIGVENKRRLVRSLEVFEITGKPMSAQQREWDSDSTSGLTMICLERDRADLYARIERRVEWMFEHGLVGETEQLLAQGLAENPTARVAAGYREVIEMLQGVRSLEETKARVKTRTRQLAKRQLTWFRHQARLRLVRVAESPEQTRERVREQIENAPG